VTGSGLVGMDFPESMAEDPELVVTRRIPAESADLGLVGKDSVGNNPMESASALVEYESVVDDLHNNLQTLPDVDRPAADRSQVILLYDTACHRGPIEYPGTVVGRLGTLGWQVGSHLPSEPAAAAAEALACLWDMVSLEGPGRHRCSHICRRNQPTYRLSWAFETCVFLHSWSVRLAWTRKQMW
jgi:hypothetical protein